MERAVQRWLQLFNKSIARTLYNRQLQGGVYGRNHANGEKFKKV